MTLDITIDRIEGDRAVLEVAGAMVDWPLSALPPGLDEGDRLRVSLSPLSGRPDDQATRMERLRSTGPPEDDIDL